MDNSVERYRKRRDERLGKSQKRDAVEEYKDRRGRRIEERFDSQMDKLYGVAIDMGIDGAAEMTPRELINALKGEGVNIRDSLRKSGNQRGSMKPDSRGYVGGWRPPEKVGNLSKAEVNKTLSMCNNIGRGHYGKATKVANADNRPFLWTFTTHGKDHVQQVIDKTNQAADEIEKMPADSIFKGAKLDRKLMLVSAWFHDTGMDGGEKDWGKDTGDGIRSAHGTQSAIHILQHAKEIEKMGVNPSQAAFIAFAHTKSKSGINDLTNPADWENGLDKLEKAAKESGVDFDRESVFGGKPNSDNIHHMMAQVAALRLGDANREAKGNDLLSQSGGKYEIKNQPDPKDKSGWGSWKNEVAGSRITITDKDGEHVLSDDDPKMSKVDGWRHSARVVLGERNMEEVNARYNEKHKNIQEDITLTNGNAVPWSTAEALLERAGELNTINGVPRALCLYMGGVDGPGKLNDNAYNAYKKMWEKMENEIDEKTGKKKYGGVGAVILVFEGKRGRTKIVFGGNNRGSWREIDS